MTTKSTKEQLVITKGHEELTLDYTSLRKVMLVLRAINHPIRQQLIELLEKNDKMIVTELHSQLRLEQSIVSQHLAVLRKAGILLTKRSGKFIYYSINIQRMKEVKILVQEISCLN